MRCPDHDTDRPLTYIRGAVWTYEDFAELEDRTGEGLGLVIWIVGRKV